MHSQCKGKRHRWRLEESECSLPTRADSVKGPTECALPHSEKHILLSPAFLLREAHLRLSLGFLLGSGRHFLPNKPYWDSQSEKQVPTVHHTVYLCAQPGCSETHVRYGTLHVVTGQRLRAAVPGAGHGPASRAGPSQDSSLRPAVLALSLCRPVFCFWGSSLWNTVN